MAVEVTKVLDTLSTKTKGKSISKTFLKDAATRYAAKIDTDADIDEFINDRIDDIIAAGVEADRRVTAALKKPKEDPEKKETKTDVEVDEDELKDAPAYVKAMMKKMEGMNETIQGFQKEKTAATIASRITGHDKLKGIPAKLLKGRIPTEIKDDEELESIVNDLYEDLKEFEGNGGGGSGSGKATGTKTDRPAFGGGGNSQQQPGKGGEKVPAAITAFTANLNKSNQAQSKN